MITAALRRLRLMASHLRYPPSVRNVRHKRINGYELLVLANEDVGRQIIALGQYEPLDTAFLSTHIRPADVCLDVGANIGYYTMLFARKAKSGHVHAFEPLPLNCHLLGASVALNGLPNVTLNMCAVGSLDGTTTFSQASDGAYSSIIPVGRKEQINSLVTQLTSLDRYVVEHRLPRIDVMKVDVEGAEALVLQGAESLLSGVDSRPRLILLELFDLNLAPYQSSVTDVLGRMSRLGYYPYFVDSSHKLRPLKESDRNRVYNVFFLRDGQHEASA